MLSTTYILNHITYTYFHLYSLFSMGNDIIIVASTTMYYTSSFSSEYLVTELLIIFYIGVI